MLIIYLLVVLTFATVSYRVITANIQQELGNKAMIMAIDIGNWLDLDQEAFDRLLSLDFHELLQDHVNVAFESRARRVMDYGEIRYIYLVATVPPHLVKYKVEEGEEEIYQMEIGTPLNVVYLLDAVVTEEARLEDTEGKGYVDKDRYTVMLPSFQEVYNNQEPTYMINKDQWGTYITGYAPYYDYEGNYLGLIGVDFVLDSYSIFSRKSLLIFGGFTITFMFMGLYALYLVIRVWKAEERARIESLLSSRDSLTGLLNRRELSEYLAYHWQQGEAQGTPIAMLIIDVDYFKEYNDHYGHRLGDEILCKIAEVLVNQIRESVDFVGRYGGDEFIAILNNTNTGSAEKIANRMMEGVRNLNIQHKHSPTHPYITISIGVASVLPSKDVTIEDLIDRADKALYHAKGLGRNSVQVWDEALFKEKNS